MSFTEDLDSLTQEFELYHKVSTDLCKERMKLLKCLELANNKLTEAHQREERLQRNIHSQQVLMQSAHEAMSSKCDLEVENIRLKHDLNAAELKFVEIQQGNLAERRTMEARHREAIESQSLELVNQQKKLSEQFMAETVSLRQTIDEQAARINELQRQFAEHDTNKQSELMHIRLEYDGRVQKLQKQLAAVSSCSTSQLTVSAQEIYRKKLQHLKEESEREIANLRHENNDLKQQLSSQQPRQSSSAATRRLYRHT